MKKNNKNNYAMLAIMSLVIIFGVYLFLKYPSSSKQVCFKNGCLMSEVVDTEQTRLRGLMNRTEIADDEGMLFVFDNTGFYPFWMKDTLIPLDMVWIDENFNVVSIKENAQPCKADPCEIILPSGRAKYVVEMGAGISKELSIQIGERVSF